MNTALAPVLKESSLKEKLQALRDGLLEGLVERDTPVRLALLAALAGEHLLLLGPPGTAKSEIARRLRHVFRDASFFERLLTRFTVPEELFGPLSIKALEQDRYQRLTESYLPRASVAFLDEIFKANSAILNSLLTLLNEREFDNGTQREKTPLVCVIGASNELPEGEEMAALYDRFLLRCHVPPVSDEGFETLLGLRGAWEAQLPAHLHLSEEDLAQVRREAGQVGVPPDVLSLLKAFRAFLGEQEISVSDRRWRKILFLLQVSAYTNGQDQVSLWDCWLLQHCVWEDPEEKDAVFDWYAKRVGAIQVENPAKLLAVTAALEQKLDAERNEKAVRHNKDGQVLYVDESGQPTTEKTHVRVVGRDPYGRQLTQKFARQVLHEPQTFSLAHIESRLRQVEAHQDAVTAQVNGLRAHASSIDTLVGSHLWISPGFSETARVALDRGIAEAETLLKRLERLHDGFSALPRRDD